MADNKPTTVEARNVSGKTTNARELEFPFDEHGFTTVLRKEGARAAGRIKGDTAKLKVFLETLKVLGEHAKTKIAQHVAEQKALAEATAVREKAEADRKMADTKRELARLDGILSETAATREALVKAAGIE